MASKFDKNGFDGGDVKSKTAVPSRQDGEDASPLNEKAQEYIRELLAEKQKAEEAGLSNSLRLLDLELSRVQTSGRPHKESKYVDVYNEKPVNIKVKALVPVKENPKFNFIGKLLGQKGATMKALQEDTHCKIAIFGKGSMRDRNEEEKLRVSLEPKYAHLSDELHVEISALAPPAEAYARMAAALAEVRKYLIPELNPDQQFQEGGPGPRHPGLFLHGPPPRGHHGPAPPPPPYRQPPSYGAPPPRLAGPPSKGNTVIAILQKARAAMGISPPPQPYGYDGQYDASPPQEDYDSYYDASAPEQQSDYYRGAPNAITTEHNKYYSCEGYVEASETNRQYKQDGGRGVAGNQHGNASPRRGAGAARGVGGSIFRSNPYSRPKQ